MTKVLYRMENGGGRLDDIEVIKDVGDNMLFKNFCALGDGAVSPLDSSIKYFREEYVEHVKRGGCPLRERPAVGAVEPRELAAPRGEVDLGEVLR
jgi:NADH-quinone oxidoreductase subunit F